MRFVQNYIGIGKRPSAHIRQRGDFDKPFFHHFGVGVRAEHFRQCIVQRAQIRIYFFLQVAGQKAEFFPRFHCRTCENYLINLLCLVRRNGNCHSQIGFSRACRSDAESYGLFLQQVHVLFLTDGFAFYRLSATCDCNHVVQKFVNFVQNTVLGALAKVVYPADIHGIAAGDETAQFFDYGKSGEDVFFLSVQAALTVFRHDFYVERGANCLDVFVEGTEQFY